MAAHTLVINLDWENNVEFKMSSKLDDGNKIALITMKENQSVAALWPGIQSSCVGYFLKEIQAIGDEMKQP